MVGGLYPAVNAALQVPGASDAMTFVVDELLPAEPKLCNKNGNMTMISDTKVVKVEKAKRITDNKRLVASQRANMADDDAVFEGIEGESASVAMTAAAEEAPSPVRRRKANDGD